MQSGEGSGKEEGDQEETGITDVQDASTGQKVTVCGILITNTLSFDNLHAVCIVQQADHKLELR